MILILPGLKLGETLILPGKRLLGEILILPGKLIGGLKGKQAVILVFFKTRLILIGQI